MKENKEFEEEGRDLVNRSSQRSSIGSLRDMNWCFTGLEYRTSQAPREVLKSERQISPGGRDLISAVCRFH